ncbi:inhibitor of apoptosis-promoting Bax1-domain-containing protein [Cokeromyces recurvatus]|uniref:inhibitor of apoptosis-promoting Bax1-domain-containing protein n=1 Tax=Cokeromyces recurvatus TaxID=90255 RepID=UPI00221E9F6C|nr:inhibitor of apoptosis-promoting Bax1-domain-containing protein [Cokeromyces recurvatus]KAI7906369.1 inhibitor of apoptosis-promoting Bax1-domain-containing protein [Cokeromyces recurvatus]
MSYGSVPYTNPPPNYDEESNRPLLGSYNNDDDMFKEVVANSSKEVRLQFVRKVYSILAMQLLATTILSTFYLFNHSAKLWVQSNQWMLIVSMIGTLGLLFALFWKARSYPLNYGLLSLFTLLEAHAIGTIVTFYNQKIVLQALIITLGVFIGLTIFTLQSKWDFTGLGPFLYAGIWILVIAGLVQMFLPFSKGIQLAFAIGGVIIFSGYILFDTYLIFNKYSAEDYIIASVSLYLDVINLFLRILEILDLMSRDN